MFFRRGTFKKTSSLVNFNVRDNCWVEHWIHSLESWPMWPMISSSRKCSFPKVLSGSKSCRVGSFFHSSGTIFRGSILGMLGLDLILKKMQFPKGIVLLLESNINFSLETLLIAGLSRVKKLRTGYIAKSCKFFNKGIWKKDIQALNMLPFALQMATWSHHMSLLHCSHFCTWNFPLCAASFLAT